MTDFKVAVGIKETKVSADSEGEAISKAMADLAANVSWVQVTRQEARPTGFRYQAPAESESAGG